MKKSELSKAKQVGVIVAVACSLFAGEIVGAWVAKHDGLHGVFQYNDPLAIVAWALVSGAMLYVTDRVITLTTDYDDDEQDWES